MFCSKCGKEIAAGEKFCSNCGAGLQINESSNETVNNKTTAHWGVLIVSFVVSAFLSSFICILMGEGGMLVVDSILIAIILAVIMSKIGGKLLGKAIGRILVIVGLLIGFFCYGYILEPVFISDNMLFIIVFGMGPVILFNTLLIYAIAVAKSNSGNEQK